METAEAVRGGEGVRRFPILNPAYGRNYEVLKLGPGSIPWSMIMRHNEQALSNHGQSLQRLAERGGLDAWEVMCVLDDVSTSSLNYTAQQVIDRLWDLYEEWIFDQAITSHLLATAP